MNFIRVNWELNDGKVASTYIQEEKRNAVLEKLKEVTNAWISEV